MTKPVPIDLTAHAPLLDDSREFLRLWAHVDGPVTCFINPMPIGADPLALGIALADTVRHGASTYARATGISEAEAEARIWAGLDAERAASTDDSHDGDDDDFINYTGKPN